MTTITQRYRVWLLAGLLLIFLLCKYLWTLLVFEIPLGYDVGIYRYLFLRFATGFPPFVIPAMDGWAYQHPLGLFVFSTILLRAGLPVDALLGWIWNVMPVALASTLALLTARRTGDTSTGLVVLLMALFSIAQFYGFVAMYWKTEAALLACILTFHFFERRSWWAVLTGVMTVGIHQQTGLLLGLSLLSVWGLRLLAQPRSLLREQRTSLIGMLVLVLGLALYLPVWKTAVPDQLRALFTAHGDSTGGSFPMPSFFLVYESILLAFGVRGFLSTIRWRQPTVWHWAVFWSALFVLFRLYFFRRFFLHLEFFLLPCAAIAVSAAWRKRNGIGARAPIVALLLVQGIASASAIAPATLSYCRVTPVLCRFFPEVPQIALSLTANEWEHIRTLDAFLPQGALVVDLDPVSAPWLRGWLPDKFLIAPGVFNSPWDEQGWQRVILGSPHERRLLLQDLVAPPGIYIYISPVLQTYYGHATDVLLSDPCLKSTSRPDILFFAC